MCAGVPGLSIIQMAKLMKYVDDAGRCVSLFVTATTGEAYAQLKGINCHGRRTGTHMPTIHEHTQDTHIHVHTRTHTNLYTLEHTSRLHEY